MGGGAVVSLRVYCQRRTVIKLSVVSKCSINLDRLANSPGPKSRVGRTSDNTLILGKLRLFSFMHCACSSTKST